MKKTDEDKREKFSIPKVINTDLTYYMQFGFKRLRDSSSRRRSSNQYLGNTYKDSFPPQQD